LTWQGDKVSDAVRQRIDRALRVGAVQVVAIAQRLVSQPAQRLTKRRKRNTTAGKKGSTYSVYIGSRPGEPPRLRSGVGRSSIRWIKERDLSYRILVASPGIYMAYLDRGTRRVAARPWLKQAVTLAQPAINRALRQAQSGG